MSNTLLAAVSAGVEIAGPVKLMTKTLLLTLAAAATLTAAGRPVVFRVSDPIQPGETALLFGDSIGDGVKAEGWRVPDDGAAPAAQALTVLQSSGESAKVVIPREWKPGLFAVRLRNSAGVAGVVYLNRAEPWWWLAGAGGELHAGEDVRVFGKNFGTATTAWLAVQDRRIPLAPKKCEAYAASFLVPESVPDGEYQLWLGNGFGGTAGEGGPLTVRVSRRSLWPTTRFDVRESGATGDGVQDDTAAIRAALAKAEAAGGGIVYLPAGRYRITGKLVIPRRTVVRGEKRETVWLFVPRETPEIDAVFAGTREFAIEELSLVSQTANRLIAAPNISAMVKKPHGTSFAPGNEAANVRLHRLRLQHLFFGHRLNKGDSRREVAEGPAAITLSGNDLELSDSEVISAGMPVAIHGARRLRIERNRLDTGRSGWYGLWGTEQVVVEDNIIEGRDLEASYGGFQNLCARIYYAGNRLQDGYGDEREALTFDSPYAPRWMGRMGEANKAGFTTREYDGTEKRWKPGELKGEVCLVAYGKGLGQYAEIADNTETTIKLVRPWDVPLDGTSHLVIRVNRTQIVVTRNHFTDASAAVQLYAQSFGIILDGNRAERTGGMYGLAWDFWWEVKKTRRYSTCMFNQWLNNQLDEGFIYQQGAWLNGSLGPAASPNNGRLNPPAETTLGNVVRNNRVRDHNTIGALLTGRHPFSMTEFGVTGYFGRDTIVEGNTVTDSPVAIEVYPGYRDTVVRNNHVERCAVPLSDDGMNTWVDPAERLASQTRAVRERFGAEPKAGEALWSLVARAAHAPVELPVAAMLIGLHAERVSGKLRLRTEPWAPLVKAEAAGQSSELKPNLVSVLPDSGEVRLTQADAVLTVRIPQP